MSDGGEQEGAMTKIISLMIDAFGFGCFFLFITGEADLALMLSCIPDVLGTSFLALPQLTNSKIKTREKNKTILVTILLEFCPIVGDVLPLWSISAFKRKKGSKIT